VFKPSVLILAMLLSGSALWSGFVDGTLSVTEALVRFLIAVPVAALMVYAFNAVVRRYANRRPVPVPADAREGLEAG